MRRGHFGELLPKLGPGPPSVELEDVFVCLHLRARTYVSKTEESKAAREVLLYVRARVQSKQRAPVGEHKHMTLGEKVMLA